MRRFASLLWIMLGLVLFLKAGPAYAQEPEQVNTRELLTAIRESKGSVTILNFWASWCAECKNEIQDLVQMRKNFAKDQLHLLGVSMDDQPAAMQRFMQKMDVNYPNYQANADVGETFNVTGVPKTYIYNQQGDLVLKEFGHLGRERLQELVQDLLQE
ncbi:MAG: TlpA family protein disulfide reductase [Desulfohalobiaceae bacterium]